MKVTHQRWSVYSIICLGAMLPVLGAQGKELARVNDRVISDKDIEMALGSFNEGQRASILRDPNSRRQLVQNAVDHEILAIEGEKLKLDQEPEFKEAMLRARKQLLMNRVLEKKLSSQLTQAAIKKHYESNKDRFSTDQVRVQQILVSDEAQAGKILKLAKDANNDFQDLAEKYSIDPTAKNTRGELGFIRRGQVTEEFSNAAFQGKEGDIVGPVQTLYGYHVIKVVQKRFGKPLEFDEVELSVAADLRQRVISNYATNLRSQYKIKVDQAAINKM